RIELVKIREAIALAGLGGGRLGQNKQERRNDGKQSHEGLPGAQKASSSATTCPLESITRIGSFSARYMPRITNQFWSGEGQHKSGPPSFWITRGFFSSGEMISRSDSSKV